MKSQLQKTYQDIISFENLYAAWDEFLRSKRGKKDVQEFGLNLIDNLASLLEDLASFSYKHGSYDAFKISDPKPRDIHKAKVRDRVLHHAIYRQLYPFFNNTFIADSFSCQLNKGVHKAINRFKTFGLKVSRNNTRTVWVLKCDIEKFFASIDHGVLMEMLSAHIPEKNVLLLMKEVIESFNSGVPGKGLPLGNLTSQLFCNIYMNEFDQYAKHRLKAKYYIRYADDFVFFSNNKDELLGIIPQIALFLEERLKLHLHPNKVFIKTLASGVDFLGWTHFPHHRVLRNVTKRRMFKGIKTRPKNPTLQSYLGLMKHGDTFDLKQEVMNWYGLWEQADYS
jgi:retron-type reverse transcriptase